MSDAAKVQQLPVQNPESRDVLQDLAGVKDFAGWPLLPLSIWCDLDQRVALGVRKYGTRLQSHNGRNVLLDLRQELLDGIMYAHQGTMEGIRCAHVRNNLVKLVESLDALEKAHW